MDASAAVFIAMPSPSKTLEVRSIACRATSTSPAWTARSRASRKRTYCEARSSFVSAPCSSSFRARLSRSDGVFRANSLLKISLMSFSACFCAASSGTGRRASSCAPTAAAARSPKASARNVDGIFLPSGESAARFRLLRRGALRSRRGLLRQGYGGRAGELALDRREARPERLHAVARLGLGDRERRRDANHLLGERPHQVDGAAFLVAAVGGQDAGVGDLVRALAAELADLDAPDHAALFAADVLHERPLLERDQ